MYSIYRPTDKELDRVKRQFDKAGYQERKIEINKFKYKGKYKINKLSISKKVGSNYIELRLNKKHLKTI